MIFSLLAARQLVWLLRWDNKGVWSEPGGGGGGYRGPPGQGRRKGDYEEGDKCKIKVKREHDRRREKGRRRKAVLWIRDVYTGSRIRLFSILDPGYRIRIKEFKYFHPKKWFLSFWKYETGFSFRILTFYPSRIPDPGVKKAPDPGSGSATLEGGTERED